MFRKLLVTICFFLIGVIVYAETMSTGKNNDSEQNVHISNCSSQKNLFGKPEKTVSSGVVTGHTIGTKFTTVLKGYSGNKSNTNTDELLK